MNKELPTPTFYDPTKVVDLRFIDYGGLAHQAIDWRKQHGLTSVATDTAKVGLLIIDNQYTFCHPQGELFVAGRSGDGAVQDSKRLVEFVYGNLGIITGIHCTLDTHRTYAIFHPPFMVNEAGEHPDPFTLISAKEVQDGKWMASEFMASALGVNVVAAQRHLLHYCEELSAKGRYDLTIWPFHGMLGGPGHAVVSGLEEACFFHSVARGAQTGYEVKGTNPWTENYSVLGPEVLTTADGRPLAQRNTGFIAQLLKYDVLIIAGQAKSHCVAWTIEDLLGDIVQQDPALARKVYLLEDCTSPVVVPGLDYTDQADAAFDKFVAAGMHVEQSTKPIKDWEGISI